MTMFSIRKIAKIPVLLAALSLFSGCDKQQPGTSGRGATGSKSIVSAEKTSFDAVTAKLDAGGCFYGYLSTEQCLEGLSGKMADYRGLVDLIPNLQTNDHKTIDQVFTVVTNLAKISGIEEISGVGMSSIARQTNLYYNKIVVHHYPGNDKGLLWSMFGKKAHTLEALDLLPQKTALAIFGDADMPLVWSTIQTEVGQLELPELSRQLDQFPALFEKSTKLKLNDVLASLDGEYGFILTLDEGKPVGIPTDGGQNMIEIPSPALAFVVKVKNDLLFDAVNKTMNSPQIIKVDKGDLKMRTQPVPLPLPLELRPTIARSGDYLILASTDALVKEMVDVKNGKKRGWKSTDDFKRLSQGVPLKGNRFVYSSRLLTSTIAEVQKNTLGKSAGMAPEKREWLAQLLSGSSPKEGFAVGVHSADGWEMTGNASDSLSKTAFLPAMIIPVGAAIAIPNFVKARAAAQGNTQYNHIINQLRQIDAAKQQWALENQKPVGAEVTESDIAPYRGRGENSKIAPIIGETYTLNPIGKSPTAKIPVAIRGHRAGAIISMDDIDQN